MTTTLNYDPWAHAHNLGARVIYRRELPNPAWVGCYSPKLDVIFILYGLSRIVERCALAHEIVHFEHGDRGCTGKQESRADRIAASRLIHPMRLNSLLATTLDLNAIALELDVTIPLLTNHIVNSTRTQQLALTA